METIHKSAAIVIIDDTFFMIRKKGKDIWTSLGGRLEKSETEEEALLREIKEEVDCEGKIIKKLGDFEAKAVFDDAIVKLSAYLVELEGKITLLDDELEDFRFLTFDYEKKGIKVPPSISEQIIPFLVKEKLLSKKWMK